MSAIETMDSDWPWNKVGDISDAVGAYDDDDDDDDEWSVGR